MTTSPKAMFEATVTTARSSSTFVLWFGARRPTIPAGCALVVAKSVAVCFALAACTPTPPPPNPALDRLNVACEAGDLEACAFILGRQDRQAEAQRAAMPDFSATSDALSDYGAQIAARQTARQPAPITPLTATQKVCPGGAIVSIYTYC